MARAVSLNNCFLLPLPQPPPPSQHVHMLTALYRSTNSDGSSKNRVWVGTWEVDTSDWGAVRSFNKVWCYASFKWFHRFDRIWWLKLSHTFAHNVTTILRKEIFDWWVLFADDGTKVLDNQLLLLEPCKLSYFLLPYLLRSKGPVHVQAARKGIHLMNHARPTLFITAILQRS